MKNDRKAASAAETKASASAGENIIEARPVAGHPGWWEFTSEKIPAAVRCGDTVYHPQADEDHFPTFCECPPLTDEGFENVLENYEPILCETREGGAFYLFTTVNRLADDGAEIPTDRRFIEEILSVTDAARRAVDAWIPDPFWDLITIEGEDEDDGEPVEAELEPAVMERLEAQAKERGLEAGAYLEALILRDTEEGAAMAAMGFTGAEQRALKDVWAPLGVRVPDAVRWASLWLASRVSDEPDRGAADAQDVRDMLAEIEATGKNPLIAERQPASAS